MYLRWANSLPFFPDTSIPMHPPGSMWWSRSSARATLGTLITLVWLGCFCNKINKECDDACLDLLILVSQLRINLYNKYFLFTKMFIFKYKFGKMGTLLKNTLKFITIVIMDWISQQFLHKTHFKIGTFFYITIECSI